jgi:hypothetical protein
VTTPPFRRTLIVLVAVLVAVLTAAVVARADDTTVPIDKAASVGSKAPNANSGGSIDLKASEKSTDRWRAYLEAVVSGLPDGATVTGAQLELYARSGSADGLVELHALSANFIESGTGGITWNNAPPYDPAVLATVSIVHNQTFVLPAPNVTGNGIYRWVITAPAGTSTLRLIASDDYTGGAQRPKLRVTWTPATTTTTTTSTTTTLPPTTTTLPPPPHPQLVWTSGSASGLTDAELAYIHNTLHYDGVLANPDISVLDRVHAAGLKAALWLGNYRDDNDSPPNCVWNTSDADLTTQVNLVKNHPATGWWFIADEPHGPYQPDPNIQPCTTAPQQVADRHALIRSLDPNTDHKTIISENRYQDYAALANTTDVLILVGYPCNISQGCRTSPITTRVNAANAAGVTEYWAMVQAFGDSFYRVPTPSEMTSLVYPTWDAAPSTIQGEMTFLWDGCSSCNGMSADTSLHATVTARNDAL